MKLEHPLIGMVMRKCVFFKYCQKKTLFFVGYPAILTSRAMKRQIQLPSLPWMCLMSRLGYPTLILNIQSANISFSTWQDDWNGTVMNKFHSVKPVLEDWQPSTRRCRKDEVVLCRARIGHTHLTHSYILGNDPPPLCEYCQCTLTVRHILVECNHFARERKNIFGRRDEVE